MRTFDMQQGVLGNIGSGLGCPTAAIED